MTEPGLKIQVPTQGWRQLLTGRKAILDAYDRAREQARAHEVETFHGRVVEAALREWLTGFLPKRYGVTSGYIVSPGLSANDKLPHFDVIIYDHLESPVLWIEDTPDASVQGRSLAIPVEYVQAVLEVKSHFSATTIREALGHLADLAPLLSAVDAPSERYKLHLPSTFCSAVVCAELRLADARSNRALDAIVTEGFPLRGFFGGAILRGEGHTQTSTGVIEFTQSSTPIDAPLDPKTTPLLEFGMSEMVQFADQLHIGTLLNWGEPNFAKFAFDLIAMMRGTRDQRLSSFYGFGSAYLELVRAAGKGGDE